MELSWSVLIHCSRRPRYKRGVAVHGSSRSSSALWKKEGPVVAHDFNLSTWDAEVGGTL